MAIEVYNTLNRRKEVFVSRDPGRVSIYVCGLTPYDHCHLGHLRPAVVWQAIRNYLEYRGLRVQLVQNFTDIDDRIIAKARDSGRSVEEIARTYSEEYLQALERLGVQLADLYPRVTRHIPQIVEMVARLVEKGKAYVVDGDVYFDVTAFAPYGKLSRQRREQLEAGARIEVDERKRHAADFALWKAARPDEPSWPSPWGRGRPGWHIECSAMSLHYLGFGFDFHGGGVDLVFPHHENELAQSEAYAGQEGFVRYWVHTGLVNVQAVKMSKSLGNFTAANALLDRYEPELLKFYLLSTHYRSPIEFHATAVDEARPGWERLRQAYHRLSPYLHWLGGARRVPVLRWLEDALPLGWQPSDELEGRAWQAVRSAPSQVEAAMDDDFNTSRALAVLFDLVREVNPLLERWGSSAPAPAGALLAAAAGLVALFGQEILGVVSPPTRAAVEVSAGPEPAAVVDGLVELVLKEREAARRRKEYQHADELRNSLGALGIAVEDTATGPRWRWSPAPVGTTR
ncbi:MAG TPA: cysteine--tRNA ligase [Limnochordales bacterium]